MEYRVLEWYFKCQDCRLGLRPSGRLDFETSRE